MTDGSDSAFGPGAMPAPWLGRLGVAPTAIDTAAAQARYAARAGWAQRRIAAALLPARRWLPAAADHAGGDLPLARLPVVGSTPVALVDAQPSGPPSLSVAGGDLLSSVARATARPILTGPMATGAPVLGVGPATLAAGTAAARGPAAAPDEPPAPISNATTPASADLSVGEAHRPPSAPAARSMAGIPRQPDGASTYQPAPSVATTLASPATMLSAARAAPSLSGLKATPLVQWRWSARDEGRPDRTLAPTPDLGAGHPVLQRPGLPSQPGHQPGTTTDVAAMPDGRGFSLEPQAPQDHHRDTASTATAPAARSSNEPAWIAPPTRSIDRGYDPETALVGPSGLVPAGAGMVLARVAQVGARPPDHDAFRAGGVGPVRLLPAAHVEPRPIGITGGVGTELPVSAGMVLRRVAEGGGRGPGLVRSAAGGAAGASIGPTSGTALPLRSSRPLPMDNDLDRAGEPIGEPVSPGSGLEIAPAAEDGRGAPAPALVRATSTATTASPVLIWRTAAAGAGWTGAGGTGNLPPGFRTGSGIAAPTTPAGAGDPVARTLSRLSQGAVVARRTDAGTSAAAAEGGTAPPPVPTEVAPVAAALPDPETLAEQVARILARRFEIERERRGGGVPWR